MDIEFSKKQRASIRAAFGNAVRAKRLAIGISQEELAFRSGLHRTYVGSVERGERNISIENIYLLAKSLNCTPAELVLDFPNPTPISKNRSNTSKMYIKKEQKL